MARPCKQGLDYFPLEVDMFRDEKISILLDEYGPLAVYTYIRILALVYENGYYLELSTDQLARIIRRENETRWSKYDKVKQMVNACVECGLLNGRLARQGVITSVAIQEQFLRSTHRRKNVDTSKYWLLEKTQSKDEGSFSEPKNKGGTTNSGVNVDNNSVNVDSNEQSKSKSKIDKKINIDKRVYGEPKLHFITQALIKTNYIEHDDLSIGDFNLLAEKLVKQYGFDMVLSVTNYIVKISKKDYINIDNPFEYFKVSAEKNIRQLEYRNQMGGRFDIEEELKKLTEEYNKKNKK
ncbi:MAG TPA: DUF4373 domain-containing protein [Bacilli bacterium]|nr:DUF4373 domain-containing protein [Bacilli bacterium]